MEVTAKSARTSRIPSAVAGPRRRDLSLDALRIFAILFVIFNHTNERGFYRFLTDEPGTFLYWFNLFFSIACKVAVPLFFMISGALLLRKQESIAKTYQRGIRIAVDLLLFSLLFYELDAWQSGVPLSLKAYLRGVLHTNVPHLWYLYSYLAFLLMLPALRGMVRALTVREAMVLFVAAFIITDLIPVAEFWAGSINRLIVPGWPAVMIFIYPVLGYFLTNRLDLAKVTGRRLALLWAANFLLFALTEVMQHCFLLRNPGSIDELFLGNNRIPNAVAIYVTFRKIFDGRAHGLADGGNAVPAAAGAAAGDGASGGYAAAQSGASAGVAADGIARRVSSAGGGSANGGLAVGGASAGNTTSGARARKVLAEVGGCTYGVYLIHPMLLRYIPQLMKVWNVFEHGGFFRNEFGIVLTVLCVFLLSLGITWVLRRIPLVKKLF